MVANTLPRTVQNFVKSIEIFLELHPPTKQRDANDLPHRASPQWALSPSECLTPPQIALPETRVDYDAGLSVALQKLVNESDCHAAFSDRRRDPFDGTEAHVTAGKYAGDACLQEIGIAGLRPLPRLQNIASR